MEFDAWARIRTWEPLREGILSPSPLTGLGYPRARRGGVVRRKTFPVSRVGKARESFSSLIGFFEPERQLTQYFTKDFFDEVATRLNADPEWAKKATTVTAKIVLTAVDRGVSFLLDIRNGQVTSSQVSPDVPADFKFEGNYDAWTMLGKGEKDFQGLVLGGKIRFRGSMPKVMGLMGQLTRITAVAQQIPKAF